MMRPIDFRKDGNLTVLHVAAEFGVDRTTVERWLRDSTLFGVKSMKEWIIPTQAVRDFVEKRGLVLTELNSEQVYVSRDQLQRLVSAAENDKKIGTIFGDGRVGKAKINAAKVILKQLDGPTAAEQLAEMDDCE